MSDERITADDIKGGDDRPTVFGKPYTEDDLMTADEWWAEFEANACCVYSSHYCDCGGSASLPSETSRLLYDRLHGERVVCDEQL
jgi:hypothetical protein